MNWTIIIPIFGTLVGTLLGTILGFFLNIFANEYINLKSVYQELEMIMFNIRSTISEKKYYEYLNRMKFLIGRGYPIMKIQEFQDFYLTFLIDFKVDNPEIIPIDKPIDIEYRKSLCVALNKLDLKKLRKFEYKSKLEFIDNFLNNLGNDKSQL